MTPAALLEEAKMQFTQLYYNDPEQLNAIVRRALGVYQDKAGVIKTLKTSSTEDVSVALPEDMLEPIAAQDKNSRYHAVYQDETNLFVVPDKQSEAPYAFYYFVNLRDYDFDTDLPAGIVGTLLDYVVSLIAIPNTERLRAIALATGRQLELSSNDEMNNRRMIVEAYMEDNRAALPMLSVF